MMRRDEHEGKKADAGLIDPELWLDGFLRKTRFLSGPRIWKMGLDLIDLV